MASSVAAVVVAAGRGLRAGGDMPKQYRHLAGEPVIRTSLRLFAHHPEVALVQPVIHPDDGARFGAAADGLSLLAPVFGGATRQASVRAGLKALAPLRPDLVLMDEREGVEEARRLGLTVTGTFGVLESRCRARAELNV